LRAAERLFQGLQVSLALPDRKIQCPSRVGHRRGNAWWKNGGKERARRFPVSRGFVDRDISEMG
ncbi:MAG TPA: hypothetical protein VLS90_15610, partial [Thermodesulfobacteriota bacterium]|nr:hypothetical protein [Thermodesulfobacteriota bacterium]